MTTEISDLGELTGVIEQAVARGARTAMRASVDRLRELLMENAPYDDDPVNALNRKRDEHLRDRIEVRADFAVDDGRRVTLAEGDTVRLDVRMPGYARFTEAGTASHIIAPRGGPYLSFFVGAEKIFKRFVKHPGTPATGWVTQSLSEWRELLQELIAEMDMGEDLIESDFTYRLNP